MRTTFNNEKYFITLPGELCKPGSGDVSVLRLLVPLAPRNDDVLAAGHITSEFHGKPAFKILFSAAETTGLAGVTLRAGAGPPDENIHRSKYIIKP
jgi:hypothetical protein